MAKIVEERVTLVLSRIVKTAEKNDLSPVLDNDKLETLQEAVEGLVDDSSIVVEVEHE